MASRRRLTRVGSFRRGSSTRGRASRRRRAPPSSSGRRFALRSHAASIDEQLGVVGVVQGRQPEDVVVVDVARVQWKDAIVRAAEAAREDRVIDRAGGNVEHVGGLAREVEGSVSEVGFRVKADDVALVFDRFQLDSLFFDHV